jgi:peptidylprolyl isomerase
MCQTLCRALPSFATLLALFLAGCGEYRPTDKNSKSDADSASSKPTDISGMKVVTTKSGLKYVDLSEGKGEEVREGDKVLVHYTGWLKNGKKFDSSLDRRQPFEVAPVGKAAVIKGWNEGLIGMKDGGRRQLIIPPELGYGDRTAGDIPPNSELIFEIKVMNITR